MTALERLHAVLLHGERIGTLRQRGDHTRFQFNSHYLANPRHAVLGLRFEENPRSAYSAALRLPKWFSNLLPEGPLREWIAAERGVSLDREMELLAQVGHDLPGAVQVLPTREADDSHDWQEQPRREPDVAEHSPMVWRFSLAGVALKFSVLAQGDRLTVPAVGERGDWLVKFPDYRFPDVPRNEFAMMSLAGAAGIDIPQVRLVHRHELPEVSRRLWPNQEEWAYAVRRFDRGVDERRSAVHIEDFAQVRDVYPHDKYVGSFETVAAIAYRGHDLGSLREFARRLAFFVLVGNGDAHLKNWSLIYPDRLVPRLSPAYDIVSTAPYYQGANGALEDLGLRFGGGNRFAAVSLASFERLENRLDRRFGVTGAQLAAVAAETVEAARRAWPEHRDKLATSPGLLATVDDWMDAHAHTLLTRRSD